MKHVVIGIIEKDDPRSYLLVSSRKDFGEFSWYYYPPGGHVEVGEDEITALVREIREELQLDVTHAEKITETAGDMPDQKTSWYRCTVESTDFRMDQNELQDAGFFTKEDMRIMQIWPATRSIFEKYIFAD